MFQIFASRMFEHRVLQAHREKVAKTREEQLLRELEEEDDAKKAREEKKAKESQKKKDKRKYVDNACERLTRPGSKSRNWTRRRLQRTLLSLPSKRLSSRKQLRLSENG